VGSGDDQRRRAARDLARQTRLTKSKSKGVVRKDTRGVIKRAVLRLARAGGREKESDAAHLMDGMWVLVYDPDTTTVDPDVPPRGNRLRLEEFLDDLVKAYEARFAE
jgi:hypothetical protein